MELKGQWIPTEAIAHGQAPQPYALLRDFPSLSRYRSFRFIGGGAFGRVFAGVHGELGRIEAVKRMEIADDRLRHLAIEEARTMARLPPHPHLVTLFNAEEHNGAIYMMMQYVDGKPLDAMELPVTVNQALAWTRDTAEALALVHAYGVVHRDIKPANIFCTTHSEGVLGDFGVARPADGSSRIAAIAGTPAYMAPESFSGQATPASDLWSLGVMLFELLTGRRPFGACESLPLDQMARALSEARLEFPSSVVEGIPSRVDDLVLMLLAPRAADRLGSAMAVLDHLPRYDTVVSARDADVTKLDVEAIALSANERLAMNVPGSVAHAVATAGGPEVVADAQAQSPAPVGSVVVTTGGRLPAKRVFHAVTLHVDARGFLAQAREADLRRALWSCFRKAHELRLKSLALPAMGTFSGGLSPEEAARMMVDVTHTYLLEFRPPLEKVVFALPDKMILLAFREAASERGMLLV